MTIITSSLGRVTLDETSYEVVYYDRQHRDVFDSVNELALRSYNKELRGPKHEALIKKALYNLGIGDIKPRTPWDMLEKYTRLVTEAKVYAEMGNVKAVQAKVMTLIEVGNLIAPSELLKDIYEKSRSQALAEHKKNVALVQMLMAGLRQSAPGDLDAQLETGETLITIYSFQDKMVENAVILDLPMDQIERDLQGITDQLKAIHLQWYAQQKNVLRGVLSWHDTTAEEVEAAFLDLQGFAENAGIAIEPDVFALLAQAYEKFTADHTFFAAAPDVAAMQRVEACARFCATQALLNHGDFEKIISENYLTAFTTLELAFKKQVLQTRTKIHNSENDPAADQTEAALQILEDAKVCQNKLENLPNAERFASAVQQMSRLVSVSTHP